MSDTAKVVYAHIAATFRNADQQADAGASPIFRIEELDQLGLDEVQVKDGLEHLRNAHLITRTQEGFVLTEEGRKACARSENLDKALFP